MPRKPKPPGSLTGSKKFEKSKSVAEITADAIKEAAQNTVNTVNSATKAVSQGATVLNNAATSVASGINKVSSTATTAHNAINSVSGAVNNLVGNNGLSNYFDPASIAHGVPIHKFDLAGAISGSLYSSESTIPEMGIVEATEHQMKIARQSNALGVGIAKTQRDRKALKLANELRLLEGDAITYHTTGIQNATKGIHNQIADREYHTSVFKLAEKDALLEQQQITTGAVQTLTPLIAEEWRLLIAQQQQKNESLKVDLERGQADMDIKRIQMEAKLIEASNQ